MRIIEGISNYIETGFTNVQVTTTQVTTVLLMATILSVYEFIIYRFVSKRSFYSKQFNITLAVLPLFISTIIMTLQSNLLITLGTIGALALVRFRTAVKDPIDMVYILWSLHTGIVCGCGLYEIGLLTSIAATILILALDLVPFGRSPYLLVVNATSVESEAAVIAALKETCKNHKVKSRSLSTEKLNLVIELRTKDETSLLSAVQAAEGVTHLSLMLYDGENFS